MIEVNLREAQLLSRFPSFLWKSTSERTSFPSLFFVCCPLFVVGVWKSTLERISFLLSHVSTLSGGLQCTLRRTLICLFGSLLVSAVLSWTRATGSLAGRFLVAVVGFAPIAVAGSFVATRLPCPLVLTL